MGIGAVTWRVRESEVLAEYIARLLHVRWGGGVEDVTRWVGGTEVLAEHYQVASHKLGRRGLDARRRGSRM